MREDQARRDEALERRRRKAEHNLEKPPLRTGEKVSDVSAREEVAFKPDEWTMRRRIAGKLGVLFIALMVLIGIVVVWLMWAIFDRYYAMPEELGGMSIQTNSTAASVKSPMLILGDVGDTSPTGNSSDGSILL